MNSFDWKYSQLTYLNNWLSQKNRKMKLKRWMKEQWARIQIKNDERKRKRENDSIQKIQMWVVQIHQVE